MAQNSTADDGSARPSIWRFANPHEFMRLTGRLLPWITPLAIVTLVVGLLWALLAELPPHPQGERVRIMFIHVPAAMMGINIYAMMIVASLIGLIRRHPVSHLAAKAAAPIGAVYMLAALVSGAFWGAPTWGAWWDFGDARLMAALILFFFYLGYIALWNAIEDPTSASELAAVLCLFGSIFAFLARYVSAFWNTLHQKTSLSAIDGKELVDDAIFVPLMVLFVANYLVFFVLLMISMRTEIRARRVQALRVAEG
ncbi:MAG: heme ABC transporter permease CcmC [Neomegalonema sp.]|nr:heme ABC transporter permease CcmC [Neomegalonema sp.]